MYILINLSLEYMCVIAFIHSSKQITKQNCIKSVIIMN